MSLPNIGKDKRPQGASSGAAHWNFRSGRYTKSKRAKNAAARTRLLLLMDLGRRLGLFNTQLNSSPGRRPAQYRSAKDLPAEKIVAMIEALEAENSE